MSGKARSNISTGKGLQSTVPVALLSALLAGCAEDPTVPAYEELKGTYIGQFGIQANYAGGASRRLFVCGGHAIITIASTSRGIIEGTWTFGPNTAVPGPPDPTSGEQERTCGDDWVGQGRVGGEVGSQWGDVRYLSFSLYYEEMDLISGAFGYEYRGGPRNSWKAFIRGDSLIIPPTADRPVYSGMNWVITFGGGR